jgi:uncharacterized protein YjbI with pentapeptide repeats
MSILPHPFTANKQGRQRTEKLKELNPIVENSSEKNRNFFIAYLSLLIYVQAIVFSTTDLQLLIDTDGLAMPLIDLKVPLVGYYVVIPIFIIALHFNFLQNLESHHYKLMVWQRLQNNQQVPRSHIFPFLFDYATLEHGSQFHWLVQVANSVLCYNLAPITLGLLLIRFSDRQDFTVTLWHFLCVVVDSYLVWQFRQALRRNEQLANKQPTAISTDFWVLNAWKFLLRGIRNAGYVLFCLLILFETLLTGFIGASESELFVKQVLPRIQTVLTGGALSSIKPKILDYEVRLDRLLIRPVEWLLPHINIEPSDKVWNPDLAKLELEAKLIDEKDWRNIFNTRRMGLQLSGRMLRFAGLSSQFMVGSELHHAELQGADLSHSNLRGSNFVATKLQSAHLNGAELQGSSFSFTNLQKADLSSAKLNYATISGPLLQGAIFENASLQGVKIYVSDLQIANFESAQLQDAYIESTGMQGTNLRNAQLQGTHLTNVNLQIADLRGAGLAGIFLEMVNFQGTTFSPKADFSIIQAKNAYKTNVPDWKALKDKAKFIEDADLRKKFLAIINQTETTTKSISTQPPFRNSPDQIAKSALLQINDWFDDGIPLAGMRFINPELSSTQAFRQAYQNKIENKEEPLQDYLTVLKDIDYNLCTLPQCADIRDKIEGLDCQTVLEAQRKSKSASTAKDRNL